MKTAANTQAELDDELLTSYLDQELASEERLALEKRLVDDEPLRIRLAEMRRAWDLLDELPETPFTPNFTQSTLEMVAIDLEKERDRAAPILGVPLPSWFPRLSTGVRTAIFIALTSAVGIAIGAYFRIQGRQTDALDVAIASRMSILQDFPDLEKLRPVLSTPGWKALLEQSSIRQHVLTIHPASPSYSDVKEYVARLDSYQKDLLWNGISALKKIELAPRKKLEDSFAKLQNLEESEQDLQKLALVLTGILQNLPMSERAEVRSLPEGQKIGRLTQELCFQSAKLHAAKLTPEEKKHIQVWKMRDLIPEIATYAPSFFVDRNPDTMIAGVLYLAVQRNQASLNAQEMLVDSLCEGLRPDTSQLIRGMSPRQQYIIVLSLAMERKLDNTVITTDDLYKQYEALDPVRREKLELKRPESAREELEEREKRERRKSGDRNGLNAGPGPLGPPGFPPGGDGLRPDRPFDPSKKGPPGGGPRPGPGFDGMNPGPGPSGPTGFPPGGDGPRPDRPFAPSKKGPPGGGPQPGPGFDGTPPIDRPER
jgi:hypothetical protein